MGEIAKRLGLDGTQVRHLAETEIVTWLKSSKLLNHSAIDDRIKHSVFRFSSGGVEIRVGDDAKKECGIVVQDEPIKSLARIGGTCGQPGRAIGRTRQVLTVEDMAVFRRGEILVAYMTDVGVVPAMRRAAAIITDVGGVTCHAAIVAREFGIPCVIGTKVGTKVLKNGYLVDVNTGIFDLLDRG
jgi:phosphohistidine swiveling domain-containing protein